MSITRVTINADPYPAEAQVQPWFGRGKWPASWITLPDADTPWIAAFRLRFTLDAPLITRLHVTADERYELFVDGDRAGRGPERGDLRNWFYESYDLSLPAGEHCIVARVWALGDLAPLAQHTVRPGFLLACDEAHLDLLATGHAPWQVKGIGGYAFTPPRYAFGVGHKHTIDAAAHDWRYRRGEGDGWIEPRVLGPGINGFAGVEGRASQQLRPATLPAMVDQPAPPGKVRFVAPIDGDDSEGVAVRMGDHLADEAASWRTMLEGGGAVAIPANTRRRIIIDLDDYYCAYPFLATSAGRGARVQVRWAESLYVSPQVQHDREKGDRDEIDGKYFCGVGDVYRPDGGEGRTFDSLWWHAGRYIELLVITGDQSLSIDAFTLRETHYPLDLVCRFEASDDHLSRVIPIMWRTMQMCSHETYMDCPYYEQLMYVGDTRMEVLATYVGAGDDRLPRKAIEMFNASRVPSGLTQSRYPSCDTQFIPPFSLWWIGMVHDYALWRGDKAFVGSMMPGVRGVIDAFLAWRNDDLLIEGPNGWNYMDWVKDGNWLHGVPPQGEFGASGVINWQFVLVLIYARALELWLGEKEHAARCERLANETAAAATFTFWDDTRGLLADTTDKRHFSEHTQCLALLSGKLDAQRMRRVGEALLSDGDLARTTIYFTHYLFETFHLLGRADAMLARMGLWFEHLDKGMRTTIEAPEPTRSDCHAWGAHPIYHYFAGILGIRPAAMGFEGVSIQPDLGSLDWARGTMPHPKGEITVDVRRRDGDALAATIALPDGLTGVCALNGDMHELRAGEQEVRP